MLASPWKVEDLRRQGVSQAGQSSIPAEVGSLPNLGLLLPRYRNA